MYGDMLMMPNCEFVTTDHVIAMRDRIRDLERQLAEWKHRAIGGTCRILSDGDGCDCSLCARDKRIRELMGQHYKDSLDLGAALRQIETMEQSENDRIRELERQIGEAMDVLKPNMPESGK